MTMPPLPIAIALVILILWPLIQIVAILATRRTRAEIRRLASELEIEHRDDASREIIRHVVASSRGDLGMVLMPIAAPVMVVHSALTEGSKPQRSLDESDDLRSLIAHEAAHELPPALERDERFDRLIDISTRLMLANWPVSCALTALSLLAVSPIVAACLGITSISRFLTFITSSLANSAISAMSMARIFARF